MILQQLRGHLQLFFHNVIVTFSWNPPPPPPNVTPLISSKITCPSEITVAFDLPLPLSAVIRLDELLILSCWMIVNCTYVLLKHGAKQCRLYIPTFLLRWQSKRHVIAPPPKRHNDVILSLETLPKGASVFTTLVISAMLVKW